MAIIYDTELSWSNAMNFILRVDHKPAFAERLKGGTMKLWRMSNLKCDLA